jgi:hypothetical protein
MAASATAAGDCASSAAVMAHATAKAAAALLQL